MSFSQLCYIDGIDFRRDIFVALHGNGSHPVVVKDGFLDVLMAYTALSGLPGDGADEYLQRLFYLFPGKIMDLGVIVKESSQTFSDAQFVFQQANRAADGSVRQMKGRSRAGKTLFFGRYGKTAQGIEGKIVQNLV